jgi:hypothetical protein
MDTALSIPAKFSGGAQVVLYTRYGDPEEEAFEQKWICVWDVRNSYPWFPKRRIALHKHFKDLLDGALRELEMKNLHTEIKSMDEAFRVRSVRGSKCVLSTHSWGAAIDLNAADNPMASEGKWSAAFIEVMEKHKIYCGQSWNGRKDPMHFAMVNG